SSDLHAHISVKDSGATVYSQTELCRYLPFKLIVILDLHHFIAFPEESSVYLFLILLRVFRIQIPLQDRIQAFHAQKPFSRRSHYLYLIRSSLYILRQLLLDQHDNDANDRICILALQEEKVSAFIVEDHRFPCIDLMGIYHDVALSRLTEDPGQRNDRKFFRCNNVL